MRAAGPSIPKRPFGNTLALLVLWAVFYGSFTLFTPALLDDADSVHAEVAREMLLRHDWVTLYANGIRYLEKAPLLYWSMAAAMGVSKMLGHGSPVALAVAARVPLALSVLALAFVVEAFARRAFRSVRAGMYAALMLLSSFGIFLFTRMLIPDAMVCLWLSLAMLCFWRTEEGAEKCGYSGLFAGKHAPGAKAQVGFEPFTPGLKSRPISGASFSAASESDPAQCEHRGSGWTCGFAACCALGVLTKGLIGVLFPIAIVGVYLLATRGVRGAIVRIGRLHPLAGAAAFFALAAPWHVLAALANPAQGHPGGVAFAGGHWTVPLPTDGNVHGWAWFYFVNEQVLRYLNLRVPHDYDTVPLWVFWGLCLIWMMPWSAFLFHAAADGVRSLRRAIGSRTSSLLMDDAAEARAKLFLLVWAAVPLAFFSFSTRQEYYVLPALPALAILVAAWLAHGADANKSNAQHRSELRCTAVLAGAGALFAAAALVLIVCTHAPAADTDLASLLQQHPGDYAMSMGHFLDLNRNALSMFRLPLAIAAVSLLLGPLLSYVLRWRAQPHGATLALAAGAFGFLFAAHVGLRTFAPVLSSQQLAAAIATQIQPDDLVVIHQEYEYGSTLGFYLQRPSYRFIAARLSAAQAGPPGDDDHAEVAVRAVAVNPIHILTDAEHEGTANYGRSSNLWYGSFFADAPAIFETAQSLAAKWNGPRRIFVWQDLAGEPSALPALPGPVYVIAKSGGKEIVSNLPNQTSQILNADSHR